MKRKWRFLDTGKNSGAQNMAIDEAIFNLREQGLAPPTLRVYTWSPPCLSLGSRQSLDEIDLDQCKKMEIEVVRRLTGGAAVLHKEELTYSLVFSEEEGVSFFQAYEIICQALAAAYKFLGIELSGGFQKNSSPNCFLSTGLTDLTYRGKKLIGSVKLRKEKVFLQHGSLILRQEPEIFCSLFKYKSRKERERALSLFLERTTSIFEIIGEISLDKLKNALWQGFENVLGIEFFNGELSKDEIEEAKKLLEKYQKLNWSGR